MEAIAEKPSRVDRWAPWLLFLLAFLLRAYRLGFQSLWLDEVTTARIANETFAKIVEFRKNDFNPPLFDLLVFWQFKLFGMGDLVARSSSVIGGALAPVVLWFISRRSFGPRVAWVASLLLVFSHSAIEYSQEARPYSLVIFFGLCHFLCGWELFRRKTGRWVASFLGFVCSASALLYLHYSAVYFLLATTLVWALCSGWEQKKLSTLLGASALIILSYAFWLPVFVFHSMHWPDHILQDLPPAMDILGLVLQRTFTFAPWGAAIGAVALVTAGIWRIWERREHGAHDLSLVFLVPFMFFILHLGIFYFRGEGTFEYRHSIIVLPFFYLAAAAWAGPLLRSWPQTLAASMLVVVLSVGHLVKSEYYTLPRKEDYRSLAHFLDEQAASGRNVPVVMAGFPKHLRYYLKLFRSAAAPPVPLDSVKQEIMARSWRRLWLVVDLRLRAGESQVPPGYTLTEKRSFLGFDLLHLEAPGKSGR